MPSMHMILSFAFAAGAALLLAAAAAQDMALRIIPNAVCVGIALTGVMLQLENGLVVRSLIYASLVFAGAVLCWKRGWMGGGDVKLLGAAALVVPPHDVGDLLVLTALSGGVLSVIYLCLSRLLRATPTPQPIGMFRRLVRAERWRICRGAPLPYGLAIASGGIALLVTGS